MQDGRSQCQARALTLFLLIGGPSAGRAQEAVTSPPFPPPGRLIDVGGWRLVLASAPMGLLETDILAAPIPTYTSGHIEGSSIPNRRNRMTTW